LTGSVLPLRGEDPISAMITVFGGRYMGLISNTTVYAKQNGGRYDMVLDGAFAMPTSLAFYRDLFANASRRPPAGLGATMVLFEQDFLSYHLTSDML
jgi:hypothetical protein